jgi:hypothetical protein
MRRVWLIAGGVFGAVFLAANVLLNPWVLEQRIEWSCAQPSLNCSQRMNALGHIWSEYLSDRERARRLYQRAADAGYAPAMFHLAWLHLQDAQDAFFKLQVSVMARRQAGEPINGALGLENVRTPYLKAAEWFRRAADKKFSPAMVMLGEFYRDGKIVPADFAQSFRWYLAGARAGNPVAVLHVHSAYRNGEGVTKDADEAKTWSVWTPKSDGPDVELTTLRRTTFHGSRVSDNGLREIREAVKSGAPVSIARILFGGPANDRVARHPSVNTSLHPAINN